MADERSPVRWSRIGIALVALLLAGEGVCRAVISARVGRPFQSFDAYTFSGYGTYRSNPHYTHPEFVHNDVGFRNSRSFSLDKPGDTVRVMAIGASVLYSGSALTRQGFSRRIGTDETITAWLERALEGSPALHGKKLEVLNTGVNRHDVRQTLAYYTAELARYDPDIVVVFGTYNDSSFLELPGGRDRLFYRLSQPSPEEERVELLLNENSLRAIAEKVVRVAANRSALAATAFRVVDRVLSTIGGVSGVSPHRAQSAALASEAEIDRGLRTYLAFLGSLLTFIEQDGAKPVVFWEYLLLDLKGIKPYTDYERSVAAFVEQYEGLSPERLRLRHLVRDRVAAYLAARGVPLVDIAEPVRTYRGNLFNDYLHYDGEGNRWVGELLARRLEPLLAQITGARRPS